MKNREMQRNWEAIQNLQKEIDHLELKKASAIALEDEQRVKHIEKSLLIAKAKLRNAWSRYYGSIDKDKGKDSDFAMVIIESEDETKIKGQGIEIQKGKNGNVIFHSTESVLKYLDGEGIK